MNWTQLKNSTSVVKRCSGCRACESICPKKCLKIISERVDYFERSINEDLCVNCGLCIEVCPQLNPPRLHSPLEGFVAYSKNFAICRRSSSGGMASVFYKNSLEKGRKCVGVRFDSDLHLNYEFIADSKEIPLFAGSKYVYSNMVGIIDDIRDALESGSEVLFIGMPCHVAGLLNVLQKDYSSLITVDITCDAIPMPNTFYRHIAYIEAKTGEKIKDVKFRDKDNEYGLTAKNDRLNIVYKQDAFSDEYMLAFRREIGYCSACYECPYATRQRCSDITIMDYTMLDGDKLKLHPYYRTSQVMINTEKGRKLWSDIIREESIEYETYPIERMVRAEKRLRHPAKDKIGNKFLFFMMNFISFESIIRMMYPLSRLFKERVERGESL